MNKIKFTLFVILILNNAGCNSTVKKYVSESVSKTGEKHVGILFERRREWGIEWSKNGNENFQGKYEGEIKNEEPSKANIF